MRRRKFESNLTNAVPDSAIFWNTNTESIKYKNQTFQKENVLQMRPQNGEPAAQAFKNPLLHFFAIIWVKWPPNLDLCQ